jgi:hypothetical protein
MREVIEESEGRDGVADEHGTEAERGLPQELPELAVPRGSKKKRFMIRFTHIYKIVLSKLY